MATAKSIGTIELSSIGIGYQIEDDMLKAAAVDLLMAGRCARQVPDRDRRHGERRRGRHAGGPRRGRESIIDHMVIPTFTSRSFRPWANR